MYDLAIYNYAETDNSFRLTIINTTMIEDKVCVNYGDNERRLDDKRDIDLLTTEDNAYIPKINYEGNEVPISVDGIDAEFTGSITVNITNTIYNTMIEVAKGKGNTSMNLDTKRYTARFKNFISITEDAFERDDAKPYLEINFKVVCNNSFSVLEDMISKATDNVTLNQDYFFDSKTDTTYIRIVNRTLTIYGNGHSINGNGTNGDTLFLIEDYSNVRMENLTLENGRAQSRSHLGSQIRMGGAIFVSRSALTIISSTFKNNKAAGGVGGAIYSDFSTLNITDSNFTDNDAAEGKSIYIQGGNGAYILNSIIDERDIANEPDWDNNDKLAQITILNDLNATLYIRSHVKGEDTTLNIIEPENLICIANLTIDSHQENNVQITNGQASINLNLDYGPHTATMTTPNIEYYADSTRNLTCTYLAASTTSNEFMVLKTVDIQLTVQNITYGEAETVTAHIDAQGNATIRLDSAIIKESIDINDKKIEYSIPMQYLTAGTHTVEVTYNGDAYTSNSSKSAEFTVYKANVTLKIEMKSEITIGETQTIKIMVDNENATGNVIIDIAGEKYTANMTKGIANFKMPTLNIGAYKITFAYQGDRNLNGNQATAALTVKDKTSSNSGNIPKKTRYPVEIYLTLKNVKKVSKKAAKLYLTVIVKRNGKKLTTKRITVKLKMNNVKTKKSTKLKNFRFLVKVNGKTYIQKTNKKGKATYRITNLYNKGTYTAKITCKSNKYYNIGKAKFKIER